MNISNVEGLLMSSYRKPLSRVNSYYGGYGAGVLGAYGSLGSTYGTGTSFYSLLQNQMAKQLTEQPSQNECCCSSSVHSKMSTDSTWLSYQKYLMQQAAIMPFGLQSSLLSSAWGSLY